MSVPNPVISREIYNHWKEIFQRMNVGRTRGSNFGPSLQNNVSFSDGRMFLKYGWRGIVSGVEHTGRGESAYAMPFFAGNSQLASFQDFVRSHPLLDSKGAKSRKLDECFAECFDDLYVDLEDMTYEIGSGRQVVPIRLRGPILRAPLKKVLRGENKGVSGNFFEAYDAGIVAMAMCWASDVGLPEMRMEDGTAVEPGEKGWDEFYRGITGK